MPPWNARNLAWQGCWEGFRQHCKQNMCQLLFKFILGCTTGQYSVSEQRKYSWGYLGLMELQWQLEPKPSSWYLHLPVSSSSSCSRMCLLWRYPWPVDVHDIRSLSCSIWHLEWTWWHSSGWTSPHHLDNDHWITNQPKYVNWCCKLWLILTKVCI